MSIWDDLGFTAGQISMADEIEAAAAGDLDHYIREVIQLYAQGEELVSPALAAGIAYNGIIQAQTPEAKLAVCVQSMMLGFTAIDRLVRIHLKAKGLLKPEDEPVNVNDLPKVD